MTVFSIPFMLVFALIALVIVIDAVILPVIVPYLKKSEIVIDSLMFRMYSDGAEALRLSKEDKASEIFEMKLPAPACESTAKADSLISIEKLADIDTLSTAPTTSVNEIETPHQPNH